VTYRSQGVNGFDGQVLASGPAERCEAQREVASAEISTFPFVGDTIGGSYKGTSPLAAPRACSPSRRVSVGWFRRCRLFGAHLHERCKVCGHKWLTAFASAT